MTDLITESELDELRDSVRDFLVARSPEARVREVSETARGYDQSVWTQMAEQLSLQGLALPEEFGGDGFSFVELSVVLREMGRALLPSPFLSTIVLGAHTLLAAGNIEAMGRHLPGIAAGRTTATLAVAERDGSWAASGVTARADAGGWLLAGEKWFVLDGISADVVLVLAAAPEGPTLFAVAGDAVGLDRAPQQTLDATRPMAHLSFRDTPATPVGDLGTAEPVIEHVLDLMSVALAAEQAGGARMCLETAAGYARDRVQFGRAIGSFQAIKHKLADMLVRVQLADAAATEAAAAAAGLTGAPSLAEAAAVAHTVCSDGYMFVAVENIQVHGGIGFTWEHPAHLYFRRAKSSQLLLGGPAVYYERVLSRSGF